LATYFLFVGLVFLVFNDLNLFKGRNLELYIKWSWIYFFACVIFAIPVLIYNWHTALFVAAMLPFVLISIYYVKQKDERAFLNDLVGIVIFAIAGMGSYYFSDRTFDDKIWLVALYPSLFFIGTTLYVKSVMRERKNPLYLKLSIGFHALCILGFVLVQQYLMALAFVPPFIRAIWLPQKKMSVKQVGFTEMGISLLFFANLLYATL